MWSCLLLWVLTNRITSLCMINLLYKKVLPKVVVPFFFLVIVLFYILETESHVAPTGLELGI